VWRGEIVCEWRRGIVWREGIVWRGEGLCGEGILSVSGEERLCGLDKRDCVERIECVEKRFCVEMIECVVR
jgi:hypothetical protein